MKSLYVLNCMPWMSQTQAFAIKLKCNLCKERKESEPLLNQCLLASVIFIVHISMPHAISTLLLTL